MEIITLNKPKEEEKEEQNAHKKNNCKRSKSFYYKKKRQKNLQKTSNLFSKRRCLGIKTAKQEDQEC